MWMYVNISETVLLYTISTIYLLPDLLIRKKQLRITHDYLAFHPAFIKLGCADWRTPSRHQRRDQTTLRGSITGCSIVNAHIILGTQANKMSTSTFKWTSPCVPTLSGKPPVRPHGCSAFRTTDVCTRLLGFLPHIVQDVEAFHLHHLPDVVIFYRYTENHTGWFALVCIYLSRPYLSGNVRVVVPQGLN